MPDQPPASPQLPQKPRPAPSRWHTFRKSLPEAVQYLYFLRCALTLWLAVPLLALADQRSVFNSLTRGIFTPPDEKLCSFPVFFVVCIGMVVVLSARIVCLNGDERFKVDAPEWMKAVFGRESDRHAVWVLLGSQVPAIYVLFEYFHNGRQENVLSYSAWSPIHWPFWEILLGIATAVGFWWTVNAIYYWMYFQHGSTSDPPDEPPTILFPRKWFPLANARKASHNQKRKDIWLFRQLARIGPGYSSKDKDDSGKRLYEGHRVAIIGLFSYLLVYFVFFTLTAPTDHQRAAAVSMLLVAALIMYASIRAAWFSTRIPELSTVLAYIGVSLTLVILGVLVVFIFDKNPLLSIPNFPVLSPVCVLATLFGFLFTAVAFLADRYRIPVLTTFFAYLIVAQIFSAQWGSSLNNPAEHFYPTQFGRAYLAPHPEDVLTKYRAATCSPATPCPIIIVTATGGGLHAAAWTADVLTQLELQFQSRQYELSKDHKNSILFHDHLLFMSTVSGGSVGAVPFLRQYYANHPFNPYDTRVKDPNNKSGDPSCPAGNGNPIADTNCTLQWVGQVRRDAHCSSLEAVAWGMEYGDLMRMLFPYLPLSGLTDRSQALENAIARNVTNPNCDSYFHDDEYDNKSRPLESLTLGRMAQDLAAYGSQDHPRYIPAFTFNTTAAETGGRFLLANYETNTPESANDLGVAPAESFLHDYRELCSMDNMSADIALTTAARLSATFPYVSSAARIDSGKAPVKALHFVDGGYFDNDGVSSAIEFLEEAFQNKNQEILQSMPLLFIEIRDSSDIDAGKSDESTNKLPSSYSHPWGLSQQLTAPEMAFWYGGHVSVTRRNRRELDQFLDSTAKEKNLPITHIVFDYQKDQKNAALHHLSEQPLSWYLTPSQMSDIARASTALDNCYKTAANWAASSVNTSGDTSKQPVKTGSQVVCSTGLPLESFTSKPQKN